MRSFIREKRTHAGDYLEIKLYTRTSKQEKANKSNRKRKRKVSRPVQKNLNHKNSKRYAKLKAYANFAEGDYYVTNTYAPDSLPKTPKEADKVVENYLIRLRRLYRKKNKELKYMTFTSYQFEDETGFIKRIHHHFLFNAEISREEIENVWSTGRGKNKKKIGRTNAKIIQADANGISDLTNYLTNQEKWENRQWRKGAKKWSSSQNLIEPYEVINDHKYSKKKMEQMSRNTEIGEAEIKKQYPNYTILMAKAEYYDDLGWHMHIELLKNKELKNRSG